MWSLPEYSVGTISGHCTLEGGVTSSGVAEQKLSIYKYDVLCTTGITMNTFSGKIITVGNKCLTRYRTETREQLVSLFAIYLLNLRQCLFFLNPAHRCRSE